MAVTNLIENVHPGKVILARQMQGNGNPVGDATLEDINKFPIGTTFTDLDTGDVYTKTEYTASTGVTVWTALTAAAAGS